MTVGRPALAGEAERRERASSLCAAPGPRREHGRRAGAGAWRERGELSAAPGALMGPLMAGAWVGIRCGCCDGNCQSRACIGMCCGCCDGNCQSRACIG
eukprot:361401-Chlamydomonas_euryale.AAC.15